MPFSTQEEGEDRSLREDELEIRPVAPIARGGEAAELHMRYNLNARHPGKLLVRVREPVLVPDPPLTFPMSGFISERRATWADVAEPVEAEGLAQRVVEVSKEDLAAPLVIEVRVAHSRAPEELVRVDFWLHRGDEQESWLGFYQCRPVTRTNGSATMKLDGDEVVIMESGWTTLVCSYKFAGDTSEVQVPLTRDGAQWIVVEFGWKSSLHP